MWCNTQNISPKGEGERCVPLLLMPLWYSGSSLMPYMSQQPMCTTPLYLACLEGNVMCLIHTYFEWTRFRSAKKILGINSFPEWSPEWSLYCSDKGTSVYQACSPSSAKQRLVIKLYVCYYLSVQCTWRRSQSPWGSPWHAGTGVQICDKWIGAHKFLRYLAR